MKDIYSVKNIEKELLGTFDTYDEALELVLKLGDKSILAKIY